MLSLGLLLHLHQPPTQFPEILKLVIDQSYRPLLRLLTKHPQARLTLNITGSLLEELDYHGYPDVISSLAGLVHKGQVEITGGSIYHALLPRIPETEAIRQITLNELALDKYLDIVGPILNREQRTDKQTVPENGVRSTDKQINGEKNPEILQDPLLRSSGLRSQPPVLRLSVPPRPQRLSVAMAGAASSVLSGFFPPEMGIDERTAKLIANLGYQWVIVDESAVDLSRHCDPPAGEAGESAGRDPSPSLRAERSNLNDSSGQAPQSRIATASGLAMTEDKMKVVVRNKDLSLKVAFGVIDNLNDFISSLKSSILDPKSSIVLAMDGETFGHHQPKLLPFLDDLMKNSGAADYHLATVSEIIRENPCSQSVKISSSTWSGGWERWADPGNEIHGWQWQLTDLAIKTVSESKFKSDFVIPRTPSVIPGVDPESIRPAGKLDAGSKSGMTWHEIQNDTDPKKQWLKARTLLDRALHSDQYWWAAGQPNWHYTLVERGARMLKEVVATVPDAGETSLNLARQLYQSIMRMGLKKYGDTVIV